MKQLLICFFVAIISASCVAQKGIPDAYEGKQKRLFRKELKEVDQLEEEWDIVLDPIESVPIKEYDFKSQEVVDNWGLRLLLPEELQAELVKRAKGPVRIKIGDTGQSDHIKLKEGTVDGDNYTTDPSVNDGHGHSTHVKGIIQGMCESLIKAGFITIEQDKVLNDRGAGAFSWIANMIETEDIDNKRLLDSGVGVIVNFSLGGGTNKVISMENALQKSEALGVFYVCAAGNTGRDVNYPGNSNYTSAVSSLDENLVISSFSSRGPEVEFAKPGRDIWSTWLNNGTARLSGTSMAAPFMTSLAAIARCLYPESLDTPDKLGAYLAKISTDLGNPGRDDLYGWGIDYVRRVLDFNPGKPDPDPDKPKERYFLDAKDKDGNPVEIELIFKSSKQ